MPTASASQWNPNAPQNAQFPGQRTVNDPYLNALRDAAVGYWARRNVTIPANVTLDVADNLLGVQGDTFTPQGRAWAPTPENPGGRIVFDWSNIRDDMRFAHSRRQPTLQRRDVLGRIATVLFHEMGHVGGQEHTETGLMAGDYGVPRDARIAIRALIPRRPPRR